MTEISAFEGEYKFLSNFSPASVVWDGLRFSTVEHAYQAAKTNNKLQRIAIRDCETPGNAKRLGQRVELVPHWDTRKIIVMHGLLWQKFRGPLSGPLSSDLLATGNANLIEGNTWHDNFWGECNCKRCPGVRENWLGRLLMITREDLLWKGT